MILNEVCKSRRIEKIDVQTPLLVPSFSSVASDIPLRPEVYAKLKELVTDASLFSAYDLQFRKIAQEEIWVSEVVFIDSGNYEIQQIKETVEQFHQSVSGKPKQWTFDMYANIVDSLKPPPFAKTVLVNYDERKALHKQMSTARDFFTRHKQFASCFLVKPCDESSHQVDIESLIDNVALIDQFDVLGLTEKELGSSLLSRCTNILEIRKALDSRGSNIPIHVFGCLDPLGIVSYFLCGADIFDGTLWLKYGFFNSAALYIRNYGLLNRKWANTDAGVQIISWILNLSDLSQLMVSMRRYAQGHDVKVFQFDPAMMKEIMDLANTAASGVR